MASFEISEGNITRRGKKTKNKKTQIMHLTASPSIEVTQTLMSAISEWELNREAWAACLG